MHISSSTCEAFSLNPSMSGLGITWGLISIIISVDKQNQTLNE